VTAVVVDFSLIFLPIMATRARVLIGGAVTYVAAVSVGYFYNNAHKAVHDQHQGVLIDETTRHSTYSKLAQHYDDRKCVHSLLFNQALNQLLSVVFLCIVSLFSVSF
jgi:hypothetical protein